MRALANRAFSYKLPDGSWRKVLDPEWSYAEWVSAEERGARIRPLQDHIVYVQAAARTQTAGGIHLPLRRDGGAVERSMTEDDTKVIATVLATGPGMWTEYKDGSTPAFRRTALRPGDKILVSKFEAHDIGVALCGSISHDDNRLRIARESGVIALVED